jgi:integrase
MSNDSTRKRRRRKAADRPKKPYPDFPLTPHASGAWQKKIRGKVHYFGRWAKRVNGQLVRVEGDGWEEALEVYKSQAEDLHAGRTPRIKSDGLTVADLCNHFLTAKVRQQKASELSPRTLMEYRQTTDLIVAAFGKDRLVDDLAADDFGRLREQMAERWGPVRLGNAITRVKSVFKYGLDNALSEKATRYGSGFKKPGKAVMRRYRARNGEKMLEAAELRSMLDALEGKEVQTGRTDEESGKPETVTLTPNPALRAMTLLGVNCGFGNGDCATLPVSAVDLERGWIDHPRPKTGIARRCWLWPETVSALRGVIADRPETRQDEAGSLVFVNSRGAPWIHFTPKGGRIDNVTIQFTALLKRIGFHRDGLGFYTLRHVFRTVADAARDPVAIDLIMGHSDPSMGGHYRERIDDSRLQAVADHVRAWLFGEAPEGGPRGKAADSCDSSDPCDPSPDEAEGGSEEPQNGAPGEEATVRPMLRLYVG